MQQLFGCHNVAGSSFITAAGLFRYTGTLGQKIYDEQRYDCCCMLLVTFFVRNCGELNYSQFSTMEKQTPRTTIIHPTASRVEHMAGVSSFVASAAAIKLNKDIISLLSL